MQVHLGPLEFDGTGSSRAKYTIETDGLVGLFNGVGVRGDSVARPLSHGDFALPIFRESRVLRLRGLVHSDSFLGQQEDLAALASVLADGGRSKFVIQSEIGRRWCTVELADEPDVEILVPGRVARYQLVVRARDPRLFGEARSFSGGSVLVENHGSFPATPVVEVAGPRSAYTITGPGSREFQVTQSLTQGQTHRIDFRSGRVYRNNAQQLGVVGRAQLWTIPAKGSMQMEISTGTMSVFVDDTYM